MRKIALALAGAAVLGFSSAASATVTLNSCTFTDVNGADACTGPASTGDTTTIGFSEAGLGNPNFEESLSFTNDMDGFYSVLVGTSSASVDFTKAVLSGVTGSIDVLKVFDKGDGESLYGEGNLLAGMYTLTLSGTNNDTGAASGTITIRDMNSAVPEPATWAMMLLGFGAIGFSLRRRRGLTNALSQIA